MTEDINVFVIGGMKVNEAVTENEDGSFSIFINDSLAPAARYEAYKHALKHIRNCDFQEGDVQKIESTAHK